DDLALVGLDLRDGFGDLWRDLVGKHHHAVLIAMDQVARLDPDAADLDGDAEVHHVDVGVRDGHVGGAELELDRAALVQIAYRAVAHDAHAAERAVDVRLDLAPLGALAAGVVEIVDHD